MTKQEAFESGYDHYMKGSSLEAVDSKPLTKDQVPEALHPEWERGCLKAAQDTTDYEYGFEQQDD